jgi:hypothetical protein
MYFVCESCNAKWFQKGELSSCPRCGTLAGSRDDIAPPWKMKVILISQKRLEELIAAACQRLSDRCLVLPWGHLVTSPAGEMKTLAQMELHELRRKLMKLALDGGDAEVSFTQTIRIKGPDEQCSP